MRHHGVAFPPEYEPRGLTVRIQGKPVKLEPLQEEMLMAWAKKLETPYVQDPVFQANFLASLREFSQVNGFPFDFSDASLADIDFTELKVIADSEKLSAMPEDKRKQVSAARKADREKLREEHGSARVDDVEVEIAAYLVEPPGIFMGRGKHPLRGKWKPRVYPEEVELNLDEEAPVEPPKINGAKWDDHHWKGIVYEHDGLWVARWRDSLADKMKYVWLSETSHLRQEREKAKYDKARALEKDLEKVRRHILKGMQARDERTRRTATVAYLIDRLAMRVGDEKDEDEADTVGASTLRKEHVTFHPDRIEFDFLGKDSVRWEKDLPITDETRLLERNLAGFSEGKAPEEQIFHDVSSAQVNDFLRKALPGLSAKVFRTYHATRTVDANLPWDGEIKDASDPRKEYAAKMANLQAAIMCNHKRTPPKNWEENLVKREQAVEKLRSNKPDLARYEAQLKARKKALAELKRQEAEFQLQAPAQVAKKEQALKKLEAEPPKSGAEEKQYEKRRGAAVKAIVELNKKNKARQKRFKERIKKAEAALEKAKQARERADTGYRERLEKAELQLKLARETRDYNLNTSLKNYIDPREYRKWGEKVGYDWTRLYTTALRRKFKWAEQEEKRTRRAKAQEPPPQTEVGASHPPDSGAVPEMETTNAG